jgi:hypothetical protein
MIYGYIYGNLMCNMKAILPFTLIICFCQLASANTYYTTTTADSGSGSLRAAIDSVNTYPGADSIILSLTAYDTIVLNSPLPLISGSVVIAGHACQNPTITATTIGYAGDYFITLQSDNTGAVEIDNVNFIRATLGAGGAESGGTAVSGNNLILHRCYFYGNVYMDMNCFDASFPAAVADTLWAYDCTFQNNTGEGWDSYGATVSAGSSGHFFYCLFAGNNANWDGSAIWGDLSDVVHCTFVDNTNTNSGGVLFCIDSARQHVSNNIFWGDTACAGCSTMNLGFPVTSGGYNILPDTAGIIIDTDFIMVATDIFGVDPMLGSIIYSPGCVPVLLPGCSSVAMRVGNGEYAGMAGSPFVNLGPDKFDTIAVGQTVNLDSAYYTNGLTVTWLGHFMDSTAVGPGMYEIIATNPAGCSDTAMVSVVSVADTSTTTTTSVSGAGSDIFNVYPNPAKDHVIVEIGSGAVPAALRLTDIAGRDVISRSITNTTTAISTQALQAGVYLLHLSYANGTGHVQKLVIE